MDDVGRARLLRGGQFGFGLAAVLRKRFAVAVALHEPRAEPVWTDMERKIEGHDVMVAAERAWPIRESPQPGPGSSAVRDARDRIVALPLVRGLRVAGIPTTGQFGLIAVDPYGRVKGLEDVYAAGDATDYPVATSRHTGVRSRSRRECATVDLAVAQRRHHGRA